MRELFLANKKDNEALEFLGDRVLNLGISDILFTRCPSWNEGRLTQTFSRFTENKTLAGIAKTLNIGAYLITDSGERGNNFIQANPKVLADSLEALIGAIYLDSNRNIEVIKKFLSCHWPLLKGKLHITSSLNW